VHLVPPISIQMVDALTGKAIPGLNVCLQVESMTLGGPEPLKTKESTSGGSGRIFFWPSVYTNGFLTGWRGYWIRVTDPDVLAGTSIGVSGAAAIHAQQTKTPPGYVIAEVEITDPTTLQKYGEKAPQIVAPFNGHYVVRGGDVQALEGEPPKGYIVVIGFDSVQKAREWYDSPAYAAIRPFR
jgi:uncharacterized protein (DUF1330 family)